MLTLPEKYKYFFESPSLPTAVVVINVVAAEVVETVLEEYLKYTWNKNKSKYSKLNLQLIVFYLILILFYDDLPYVFSSLRNVVNDDVGEVGVVDTVVTTSSLLEISSEIEIMFLINGYLLMVLIFSPT